MTSSNLGITSRYSLNMSFSVKTVSRSADYSDNPNVQSRLLLAIGRSLLRYNQYSAPFCYSKMRICSIVGNPMCNCSAATRK